MSVVNAHITLDVGCDFDAQADNGVVWIWESGPAGEEELVDLTGSTTVMKVRRTFSDDDEDVLLTLTDEASSYGQVVLGGTAGTIEPRITSAGIDALVTAAGGTGHFVYDIVITLSTGKKRKFASGNLVVKQTASRSAP